MISTSTTHVAIRKQGVCRGTLWRQEAEATTNHHHPNTSSSLRGSSNSSSVIPHNPTTAAASGVWSDAKAEYCCVTLNWLICHESVMSYERGDAPVRMYQIVGASSCEHDTANLKMAQHAFRLVTNQGTQLFCQAVTQKCREYWLAALNAGLELALLSSQSPSPSFLELQPPPPQVETKRSISWGSSAKKRYCCSCGALENPATKPIRSASPVMQYGMESRTDLCKDCFIAQGLLHHLEFVKACMASAQQELTALCQARHVCYQLVAPLKKKEVSKPPAAAETAVSQTLSGGAVTTPSSSSPMTGPTQKTIMTEFSQREGAESPPPLPLSPAVAAAAAAAGNDDKNSDGSNESWTAVEKPDATSDAAATTEKLPIDITSSPTANAGKALTSSSSWIHVSPTSKNTTALLKTLRNDKRFSAWMRLSPFLQSLSEDLLEGRIGVVDFLEQLDEAVGQAEETNSLTALKKEAFKVAGDMGTAMKLLLDNALPKNSLSPVSSADDVPAAGQLQTMQCLLEFFLDLCQDGELTSVAFYWPQLCHLHLCMLPPDNALAVARVDLMEDFLLTVATKYSTQLALELVWSHSADLEESLASSSSAQASPVCRVRRFAVLRFVCELESLLFGHEDGWGGGSVTLGKMLSATGDQLQLLRKTITKIQDYRHEAVCQLTQHHSVRRNLYQRRLAAASGKVHISHEALVQEKLRIAKNADYFTSHLNFTKRVCDIAEKLRFMDLRKRADALHEELTLLNSSGAMGGDPLNRTRDPGKEDSFVRIVRVPATEGHVFRSKERTPVLLLVELVDEGAEPDEEECRGSKSKNDKFNIITERLSEDEGGGASDDDYDDDNLNGSSSGLGSDDDEDNDAGAIPAPHTLGDAPSLLGVHGSYSMDEVDGPPTTSGMDDSHRSSSRRPANDIASVLSNELEGASEHYRQHAKFALKRFDGADSGATPNTPKRIVDRMITDVMVEQLTESGVDPVHLTEVSNLDPTMVEEDSQNQAPLFSEAESAEDTKTPDSKYGAETGADDVPKDSSFVEVSSPRSSAVGLRRMFKNSVAVEMGEQPNELAPTGDIRREVLNVLMMRGRKDRYSIAAGTADSVQRSLKELETRRATALLLGSDEREKDESKAQPPKDRCSSEKVFEQLKSTTEKLASLGFERGLESGEKPEQSEEDEVMEAVRLLLIQNRVAQGHLSPSDAAKVLQHVSLGRASSRTDLDKKGSQHHHPGDMPTIDAGDLDPRLAGCGPLPPAVLQALTLWKGEMVSNGELLELVKKDIEFVRHSVLLESESVDKLKEDSAFWGRFAFGERWAEKKARIAASSPQGSHPGWDLVGIIVKSNDDLRQEAFVMQLIELCQEAFEIAGLELWVNPYRILATGRTTGIIEMVRNAMSFDALKKRPGYGRGGLREHLQRMTEFTADPGGAFKTAQQNFVRSLAAYSILSYLFLFKDRHNGNLLLDTAGHVIHIDFGFVFGVAPGGSFSLEMSTPFKLTEEMLEVMGGLNSPLFSDFVTLFCCGFLALQSYSDTFFTLVEITSRNSTFKCFDGLNREEILSKLRERFCPNLNKEETIAFALDLIKQAVSSYGTRQYDLFQYLTQGVAA